MNVKVHYRITQDRAGLPSDYTGARHFTFDEGAAIEDAARTQLALDYQVPPAAVEIFGIDD